MSKQSYLIMSLVLGVFNFAIPIFGFVFSFETLHLQFFIECVIVIVLLIGYNKNEEVPNA